MKLLLLISGLSLALMGYLQLTHQVSKIESPTCQSIKNLSQKLYEKHVTSLDYQGPFEDYYKNLISGSLDEYLDELDPFRVVFSKKQYQKIQSYNTNWIPLPWADNKVTCDELVYVGLMFDKQLNETLKLVSKIESGSFEFVKQILKDKEGLSTADSKWPSDLEEKIKNLKTMYAIAFDDIRETTESDREAWVVSQRIIRRRVDELHVDTEKAIVNKILKGLMSQMDAHSRFFSQSEFEEAMKSLLSTFVGVGIVVAEVEKGYKVIEVIEGGPSAQQKKLLVNDLITSVDGHSVENQSRTVLADLLSGPDSSVVQLDILRKNKAMKVSIARGPVRSTGATMNARVKKVQGRNLGLIHISHFYADDIGVGGAAEDFKQALQKLITNNEIEGLVIDLRGNGGGILNEVIKIAGLFIDSGPVVFEYGTVQEKYESYDDLDGQTLFQGPLVILVDSSSASAAEILAGSLRDYNRAIVVGSEQSYGKGTIQEIGPIDNVWPESDINGAVKITIGYYYLPLGESVQFNGVKSDIVFPEVVSEDREMEKQLKNALKHPKSMKLSKILDKVRKWTPDATFLDMKNYLSAEHKARTLLTDLVKSKNKKETQKDLGALLSFDVLADMTKYYEQNMPGQLAAKTTAQWIEKKSTSKKN